MTDTEIPAETSALTVNQIMPVIHNGFERTFTQMWEIFFGPEIERRMAAGSLSNEFALYMAQVLFPPEGLPRILLNEEIKGDALMRAQRPITEGQAIQVSDLYGIERFDLPDEFLDNGHFTIISRGDGWGMHFNFLSGRAKAKDMLEHAGQFLEAALSSRDKGHAGPAVDNLFSASELISKAELILQRSRAVSSKKHKAIAVEINAWAKLGNIDAAFVALFNKISQQRPNARYGDKANRPPIPDPESFELVGAMIEKGLRRTGKVTDRLPLGGAPT
jgi:HEPN domain-containing protein